MAVVEIGIYYALRRTNTDNGKVLWLAETNAQQYRTVYEPPGWDKPRWKAKRQPTWFVSEGDARKRLRCKVVTKDASISIYRWDIVEVKLVEHYAVVYTTAEDAITRMALLSEDM